MKKLMMVVAAVGLAAAAWADAHISYSGQLCLADGSKITDQKTGTVAFRLYADPTSAKPVLWARELTVLLDANGFFAVELHDTAGSDVQSAKPEKAISLDDILAKYDTLYIGLTVKGASGEITPRQKLLSTPRAVFAQDVNLARNDFTVKGVAKLSGGIEAGANKAFTVSNAGDVYAAGKLDVRKEAVFTKGATFSSGATFGQGTTFNQGATFGQSATFSQGATFNQGVTFTNGISVTGGIYDVMPVGTIVMWYGKKENVPKGWAICDGNNGTPNLCGRFPMAANENKGAGTAYDLCSSGGVAKVQLKEQHLPSHSHSIKLGQRKYNTKMSDDYWGWGVNGPNSITKNPVWDTNADWFATTDKTGGGEAHENLPPYMALYFIMRTNGSEPALR